jgi:hypothetical protein
MKSFILSLLSISLFSTLCVAQDFRISKEDFLNRVMHDTITLDRSLNFQLPPKFIEYINQKKRERYPGFKDEMAYSAYYQDNKWVYTINFEADTRLCKLRIEEKDPKTDKPSVQTVDPVGETIDKKYCDKAYGLTL